MYGLKRMLRKSVSIMKIFLACSLGTKLHSLDIFQIPLGSFYMNGLCYFNRNVVTCHTTTPKLDLALQGCFLRILS